MRAAFSAIFLLSSSVVLAADLTADEIRDQIVGRDIFWWENDGWHAGALYLLPDGKAEVSVETPDSARDSGRWTMKGNEICTNWKSVRGGEMKCYSIQRGKGRGQFITSGGNIFVVHEVGV